MKKLKSYEKERNTLLKKWIEKNGYKLTNQREEILLEFIKNRDKHLTAEDIYLRLNGIGMATIYRNLKLFTNLEILKEIKIDGKSFYELKMYAKKPLHMHLICEKCGCMIDIDNQDIILNYIEMNNVIEKTYEAEILDTDIIFYGICKSCKDKNSKKT